MARAKIFQPAQHLALLQDCCIRLLTVALKISGYSESFALKVRPLLLIIQMAAPPLATVRLNKLGLVLVFIGHVLETVRIVLEEKAGNLAGHNELRRAHLGR
jgi:hypothetical protein